MDIWEYCEVANEAGKVAVRHLTEEGNGWAVKEFAEPDVNNMARVLAALGKQGWEVVAIHPYLQRVMGANDYRPHPYTWARTLSQAFLKRHLQV